jgi:hypothetical protein
MTHIGSLHKTAKGADRITDFRTDGHRKLKTGRLVNYPVSTRRMAVRPETVKGVDLITDIRTDCRTKSKVD